jgi:hypothetical protein
MTRMADGSRDFPWAWLLLVLVVIVAGLAALGGWRMGQRTYAIDVREVDRAVAAGAQFGPPRGRAPAVPSEQAVSSAEQQMTENSLPHDATEVSYGHLMSSTQGIDADVWLVTFPGYCTISTGTPGGPGAQGIAKTLVAIDAATGHVLTTLVDVDWGRGCVSGSVGTTINA